MKVPIGFCHIYSIQEVQLVKVLTLTRRVWNNCKRTKNIYNTRQFSPMIWIFWAVNFSKDDKDISMRKIWSKDTWWTNIRKSENEIDTKKAKLLWPNKLILGYAVVKILFLNTKVEEVDNWVAKILMMIKCLHLSRVNWTKKRNRG